MTEEHPSGMIDLKKVRMSMIVEGKLLDVINKQILKEYGSEMLIPTGHHVLIIDMGISKDVEGK